MRQYKSKWSTPRSKRGRSAWVRSSKNHSRPYRLLLRHGASIYKRRKRR